MPTRTRGFSLIELMVTLALGAILIGLSVPSLTRMTQAQQLKSASHTLHSSLLLARSESIKRREPVLVSAQDARWANGWRVFADLNGNGLEDATEPLLLQVDAQPENVRIQGNTPVRQYVRYTPDGSAKLLGGAFQAGTLSLCQSNGEQPVRQLILSATGRVRRSQAAPGDC